MPCAWQKSAQEKIHLLMTDVMMPGMTGHDLADTFQARNPGLKVLFQSSYASDLVVPYEILHVSFLHRPFRLGALAKKVRVVLDQRSYFTGIPTVRWKLSSCEG
jgi:DNA-binding NtrC family response regulator